MAHKSMSSNSSIGLQTIHEKHITIRHRNELDQDLSLVTYLPGIEEGQFHK